MPKTRKVPRPVYRSVWRVVRTAADYVEVEDQIVEQAPRKLLKTGIPASAAELVQPGKDFWACTSFDELTQRDPFIRLWQYAAAERTQFGYKKETE